MSSSTQDAQTFSWNGGKWPVKFHGEPVTPETLEETRIGFHIKHARLSSHGLVDASWLNGERGMLPKVDGHHLRLGKRRDEAIAACEDWKPDISDDESGAEDDPLVFTRKSKKGKLTIQRLSTKKPTSKTGTAAIFWTEELGDASEDAMSANSARSRAEKKPAVADSRPRAPRARRMPMIVEQKAHNTRRHNAEEMEDGGRSEEKSAKRPKRDAGEATPSHTAQNAALVLTQAADQDGATNGSDIGSAIGRVEPENTHLARVHGAARSKKTALRKSNVEPDGTTRPSTGQTVVLERGDSQRIASKTSTTSAASATMASSSKKRPPIILRLPGKAMRQKYVQGIPASDQSLGGSGVDQPVVSLTAQDSAADPSSRLKDSSSLPEASFRAPKKGAPTWLSAIADAALPKPTATAATGNAVARFDYTAAVAITGTSTSSDGMYAAIRNYRRMVYPEIPDDDTEDESDDDTEDESEE